MNVFSINKISALFWILVAIEILGLTLSIPYLHYAVKPMLIPVLIVLMLKIKTPGLDKNFIIAGLVFSFLGDVFLLFEKAMPLCFILGLVFFLTTHLLYIAYFLRIKSNQTSLLKKQPLLIILVCIYGLLLIYFLYPHLGTLTIPVIIYAIVICTMLLSSLHVYYKTNSVSNKQFIAGAALFVLSDSVLAIDKFYHPLMLGGAIIMLTYCAAQFLIVKAVLSTNNG